jgi:Dockerin type I domain
MAISWVSRWCMNNTRTVHRPVRSKVDHGRFRPRVEALTERVMPAVTATFSAAGAILRVVGDALDNSVVVSRDAAGTILVNNGDVPIQGGPATVANTHMIMINGAGGNDSLSIDERSGAMPSASIFGGAGNDRLGGTDGPDFFDGGTGNDEIFMGDGDDTFQWNPGDGSDLVDGGGGNDTMIFNGSDLAEEFDISANVNDPPGADGFRSVRFMRDIGSVVMDLSGLENIDLSAFGGADAVAINDQSLTALLNVNVDLAGAASSGDGAADSVVVNGSDQDENVQITAPDGHTIHVTGLSPNVTITGSDGTTDHLSVNSLGGNDSLNTAGFPANLIGLLVNLGDGQTAPKITNVAVNGGAAQRSRVTDLSVTFSTEVSFATSPGAAFVLRRNSDGAIVNFTATASVINGVTVVSLSGFGGTATQFGSLADGNSTLTTLANQVSFKGFALDGNGDGQGGDNNTFFVFRLFGDINGDRHVDIADFGLFSATFNLSSGQPGFNAAFDFNGDGRVDIADFGQFSVRFFTNLP